jgi:hypothetical protein
MSVPSKEISPLLGSYSLYTKGTKIKEKMEGVFYCKISPKKCEVAGPDPDNQHETVVHNTYKKSCRCEARAFQYPDPDPNRIQGFDDQK